MKEKSFTRDRMYLIDSNILVYAYDKSEPKKREKAKNLLEKCWRKEKKFALSIQNLSEFFVAVTEKIEKPISKSKAHEIISDLIEFENWTILTFGSRTVLSAINYSKKSNVPYWDGLIVATMLENQVFKIYTENTKHFRKIKQITPENPFK